MQKIKEEFERSPVWLGEKTKFVQVFISSEPLSKIITREVYSCE